MLKIDYRSFIQDNFFIINKEGILIPFKLNEVQNWYYDLLLNEYGEELQGLRENVLKGRQFGLSTLIEAIFAVDFILSELQIIPRINSSVYSYTDNDTKAHTARFDLFLESYLMTDQGATIEDMETTDGKKARDEFRKAFLSIDNGNYIEGRRGAQYHSQTASARVSGRGDTKQNIHWTEPAFYPNTQILSAEDLMTGAEEQVADGTGKIFRESTGKTRIDYFGKEYLAGKDGKTAFKSRFIGWFRHPEYAKEVPEGWVRPEYYDTVDATDEQCYWHYTKTNGLTSNKKLREYPTHDHEAFIAGGTAFFDSDALLAATLKLRSPIKEAEYVSAL